MAEATVSVCAHLGTADADVRDALPCGVLPLRAPVPLSGGVHRHRSSGDAYHLGNCVVRPPHSGGHPRHKGKRA